MPIKTLCVMCNKLTRSHWSCPSKEIANCAKKVKTLSRIGITIINNAISNLSTGTEFVWNGIRTKNKDVH